MVLRDNPQTRDLATCQVRGKETMTTVFRDFLHTFLS